MADLDFKKCSVCGELKLSDDFNKHSRSKGGLYSACRNCQSIQHKKEYQRNKDRIKKKGNEYYKNNKDNETFKKRRNAYYRRTQKENPVALCKCGCGEKANPGRSFILGHVNRGRIFDESFRLKQKAIKQNINEHTRKKMSESAKGKIISLETRRRISQSLNGRPVLETTRKKIGEANRGRLLGSRHPQWLGGISREPYAFVWTKDLKAYIMERDGYECKNRTCHNDSSKLCVHHIDYDKKNCDHDNLITLCNSCNARANFNREMWEKYYHSLIDNALNVQGVL